MSDAAFTMLFVVALTGTVVGYFAAASWAWDRFDAWLARRHEARYIERRYGRKNTP